MVRELAEGVGLRHSVSLTLSNVPSLIGTIVPGTHTVSYSFKITNVFNFLSLQYLTRFFTLSRLGSLGLKEFGGGGGT